MSAETWLLFALTEIALCVSPGPAVLYVTSNALYRGFGASAVAAAGIVTGNVVYFALSALGIGALILATGDGFLLVRWLGVAYLAWLGIRMWRGGGSFAPSAGAAAPRHRIYWSGVAVQLSNPKNLVFFVAILPPFIETGSSVPMQVLILGVTSQVIETAVLLGYGGIGAAAGRRLRDTRIAIWVDRLAGSLLLVVALSIAVFGGSL